MNCQLKYGNDYLEIPLSNRSKELMYDEIDPITDIEKELNHCLNNPIESQPFDEVFKAGDKVVIVTSDITRLWIKLDTFLPFLVKRLNNLGIADQDIVILMATGTHRSQTPEEHEQIVGKEIFNRIKVIDHDCDNSEMAYVGETPRGTKVTVNKLVTDRKVIITGGIVHHLMAGFGGGRKSIVPGVASSETVAQNHLHALDPGAERSNPLTGVGKTTNNPLNLDMIDCCRLVEPDFLLNVVTDPKGNLAKFVAGHWFKAWEAGCRWADEKFGVPIEKQGDLVIASCGGYPKDISLYQSTKALFNAAMAVKPGGTILLLAQCPEGAGADEYFGWSKPLIENKLDQELRKSFTIPGYVFYATVEIAQRNNVILLSDIDPELLKPMGIIATPSLETALQLADIENQEQDIIVMPYGGNTIPLQQLKT